MKKKIRLSYNAPVSITFSLACTLIFLIDKFLAKGGLIPLLFTVPGNSKAESPFDWINAFSYIRLFTHVLGHINWNHLLANLSFILLLGPLMEEKYGSPMIALMMTVTAAVTGIINACFIPTSLTGSSGISFMLILLASISTISKNMLPLSFLLLIAVFILREFISPSASNVSTIAHIAGGLCGSLFGFLVSPKSSRTEKNTASRQKREPAQQSAQPASKPGQNNDKPQTKKQADDGTTVIGTIQL